MWLLQKKQIKYTCFIDKKMIIGAPFIYNGTPIIQFGIFFKEISYFAGVRRMIPTEFSGMMKSNDFLTLRYSLV